MGVTSGACAWLRLVYKRAAFFTIGDHPPVFSPGEHKQDNQRMHVLAQPVPGQMDRVVQDSPIGMGGSLPSLFTPVSGARRSGRGMRPARWNSRSLKKLSCDYVVTENSMVSEGKTSEVGKLNSFSDGLVVKRNVGDAPLPGDDVNSHPSVCPRWVLLKRIDRKVTGTQYLLGT